MYLKNTVVLKTGKYIVRIDVIVIQLASTRRCFPCDNYAFPIDSRCMTSS